MHTTTDIHNAASALGRMGGASTSPAKQAASRANGAKGGRPVKPAGKPHVWTMREVAAVMGDRSYTAPAGRGLFVRAACFPGEFEDSPAWFDLQPSWGDAIGRFDNCDATVDALVRRIEAKFPPADGHFWQYDPANGTIEQA